MSTPPPLLTARGCPGIRRIISRSAFPTATIASGWSARAASSSTTRTPRSSPARSAPGATRSCWPSARSSRARASGPCRRATWSSARRPSRPPQREASEEACATHRDRPPARHVQRGAHRPGADHVSRAAGERRRGSRAWRARKWRWSTGPDIPWEQLAFPDRGVGARPLPRLARQDGFRDLLNPTGDLARMWPPRKAGGTVLSRIACVRLAGLYAMAFAIIVRTFGTRTNLEESMLTAANNEMLTRVGPGTPMGNLMREYWIPACLSSELKADGEPMRLMLLGERLIAFRDTDGRVGVMEHRCPHRCASLFFGRNEEGGLRCVYHGWKFDVEGNCLDMPNVPPAQDFKAPHQGQGLQGGRARGLRLDLHGQRARSAAAAQRRGADAARGRAPHARAHARVQLVPVARGRHRHLAFRLPACRRRQDGGRRSRPRSTAGRWATGRRTTSRPRPSGARCTRRTGRPSPAPTTTASPISCSRSSR